MEVTDNHVASLLLNRAAQLNFHTGNLVNWRCLKKKMPSPSEELQDCIRAILAEWRSRVTTDGLQESPDTVECSLAQTETVNADEREELKVSAKLFITCSDSAYISNAVNMACAALDVSNLDSVIIAPPPLEDGTELTLEHLQPYWGELENLVHNKQVLAIGTSDLDKTLLEQLYQWAQVKPSSNQVNLASCCVMPPELTAFAKEFDIQLLTHNDSKEMLSATDFQEAIKESIPNVRANEWKLKWILRYSTIVKSRGIIKSKGYILQAKKSVL
ncbi:glutamate--cysteine ligase regulatory subunit isoform X1 [Protopterus annectens]|uniref:glutamate--cysteine ligase regulatory subunit isoform X1 n=1 Tax=Protopterus annectens TaxID=7888 RepID=UPI001CFAC450|nr:glutamate--cysteine ligase regulatory subunit isoform X1 [Protopterus annectens]